MKLRLLSINEYIIKHRLDDGQDLTNPKLTFAHADSHIQVRSSAAP